MKHRIRKMAESKVAFISDFPNSLYGPHTADIGDSIGMCGGVATGFEELKGKENLVAKVYPGPSDCNACVLKIFCSQTVAY